ncbi:putative Ig domain-containing protein [Gelidibacter algens]|uniref:Putative Ig domain-containing protein n=1 Tax=Gelidibacter algens TaxID=49280 RepID=A0A1A7R208_9FLAO|nr:putative Ig domain-containing protein [Gelidibacter algens]OBX26295.1 hypothetical protein A9996_05845 [Gelidibacter algens]RAJ24820.1 putative Ig domain-containing protein [Gelidibacter algens]
MKNLLFVLAFVLCLSCENILECIINRSPEIPDTAFVVGNVDSYYYQELTSEIKNEPRDEAYGYSYRISGNLPDGLEMYANNRTLSIEGTPKTSGTFTFTIHLYVDPPEYYDEDSGEYEDALCSRSTSKKFSIIIN